MPGVIYVTNTTRTEKGDAQIDRDQDRWQQNLVRIKARGDFKYVLYEWQLHSRKT